MPIEEIAVMTAGADGSVDAYLSADSTKAILIVLSVALGKELEQLDAKLFLKDGVLYLKHECELNGEQLIDTSWVGLFAEKLKNVGKAIHDKPSNPDKTVFQSIGIKQSEVDKALRVIRERPALFKTVGLYDSHGLKSKYFESIKSVLTDDQTVKVCSVLIAAVCVRDIEPFVVFFKYNKDNLLQKNGRKFSRIECAITLEQAEALNKQYVKERAVFEMTQLRIRYRPIVKSSIYELISFEINEVKENRSLDFDS